MARDFNKSLVTQSQQLRISSSLRNLVTLSSKSLVRHGQKQVTSYGMDLVNI